MPCSSNRLLVPDRHVNALQDEVAQLIETKFNCLAHRRSTRPLTKVADAPEISNPLQSVLQEYALRVLETTVTVQGMHLEQHVSNHVDITEDIGSLSLAIEPTETHIAEAMRRRIARTATIAEEEIRSQVCNTLQTVDTAANNHNTVLTSLSERPSDLAEKRVSTIAQTELFQASRDGAAALAEATDVVAAKRWRTSENCPAYAWHTEIDGTTVPTNEPFVVPEVDIPEQPDNYPKATFVVGAEHPNICRCVQEPVVAELPEDIRELRDWDGVEIDLRITDRQYEIWREYANESEDFRALLSRLDEEYSRTQAAEMFCKGSKKQYYSWLREYGLK